VPRPFALGTAANGRRCALGAHPPIYVVYNAVMRAPDNPLIGEVTVVRRATADDVDLLVGWHADPDVSRYWDGETFTREEIALRLARPDVDSYIVEEDRTPVGYIQAWFEDDSPNDGGLDMFLVPSARGRGLGPDAARSLAHWLLSAGRRLRVTVDPYLSNERAIRAWVKAGFRPIEERDPDHEHVSRWLLMSVDRAGLGLQAPSG
jgi:aminoglycoside 6'-N-acetyltransferase